MCLFRSKSRSLPSFSLEDRSSASVFSRASSIFSATSWLSSYCFLFPANWNLGSTVRCFLATFGSVAFTSSFWRCFNSAALDCCCWSSCYAHFGSCVGDRKREQEPWDFLWLDVAVQGLLWVVRSSPVLRSFERPLEVPLGLLLYGSGRRRAHDCLDLSFPMLDWTKINR